MDKDCHGRTAQRAGIPVPRGTLERLEVARAEASDDATLRHADVPLCHDGRDFVGHMCWCEGAGPRPLVLVVHNYAGLKRFDKEQAAFLARCGFAALAVDMYGADTSDPAMRIKTPENATTHFRMAFGAMNKLLRDHVLFRGLLRAWLAAGRAHPSTDIAGRAAAIGYCFGGMAMFEMVRDGMDVDAVVSFHGVPQSNPIFVPGLEENFDRKVQTAPNTYAHCKVRCLVENGAADTLVPREARDKWTAEMDAASIDWIWHDYARTPHGFALAPDICTEYTEDADRRSTLAMLALFQEAWPDVKQNPLALNACGTPFQAAPACPGV